ncbi:MAG: glycosyltransferase family 4 protein [Thermoanaerobaculia bacterium]|nr:MAG: glycosyltransferase family 4 protein [Thermoanaerobaculia bacterium]MBZ0100788.1 glycosyltransferase family 4 protein [Thermoanaerobaculia bacterium]
MTPRVLVAHPGRQHSHQTAAALARAGCLEGYWSGVPLTGPWARAVDSPPPASACTGAPWAPGLRRVLEAILPETSAPWGGFLADRAFDRWAAARVGRTSANLVIGYEMGCRDLLDRARRSGVRTVLDAASFHHRAQDEWRRPPESPRLHRKIVAAKERELELAEHVFVASELAAETYRAAGVPAARLSVLPLGVDLLRFQDSKPRRSPGLKILFVGKLTETKGFDLLLQAFDRVRRASPDATLRVAGQGRWPGPLAAAIECGRVAHEQLPEVYSAADVLVLPSRLDGFGMVVSEALACGTPVLVSDRVGAKDLVQEGVNGWVVPAEDAGKLAERLSWCADHLPELRALRETCRRLVEPHGWEAYGERLVAAVRRILAEPRA